MKIGMFLQLETPSPRKTPWEELNFFCLIWRKPTDSWETPLFLVTFHLQDTPPNFVEILLAFLSEKTKQLFCTGVSLEGPSIFEDDNDIQVYIPRTQMTLVLVRKGLVLRGWPSKIEVSWVLGVYIYLHIDITAMKAQNTSASFQRTWSCFRPFLRLAKRYFTIAEVQTLQKLKEEWNVELTVTTWRIIPVTKWLVTPIYKIYKPIRPFGRGITLHRELTIHGY